MFISAACVHFCGVIFYGLFASGELQPWAEPPPEDGVPPGSAGLPGPPGGKWDPMEGSAPPPRPAIPPPTYSVSTVPRNDSDPRNSRHTASSYVRLAGDRTWLHSEAWLCLFWFANNEAGGRSARRLLYVESKHVPFRLCKDLITFDRPQITSRSLFGHFRPASSPSSRG